jgi:hypothetical protein
MRHDFFICHSSRDTNTYVAGLVKILDELSLSYWLDAAELSWGDQIENSLDRGIQGSKFIIPIITSSFLESPWTDYEMAQARRHGAALLPLAAEDDANIFNKFPTLRDVKMLRWTDCHITDHIRRGIWDCLEIHLKPYTDQLRKIEKIQVDENFSISRIEYGEGPNLIQVNADSLLKLTPEAELPRPDRFAVKALFMDNLNSLRNNTDCHFPQEIRIFGRVTDDGTKSVAAYVCTDTFYFQDSQVVSGKDFELTCKLDRGGIAAFVDAQNGSLIDEDSYSLGEGFGAISAIVVVAFDKFEHPIHRSAYTIAVRKGIKYPDDIWTSRKTNRPITNSNHGEPLSTSRFVFQSAQPNGGCSDIYSANFDGSDMRNLTKKTTTAYDGFFDENDEEVVEWIDRTTIRYASRASGIIKIVEVSGA